MSYTFQTSSEEHTKQSLCEKFVHSRLVYFFFCTLSLCLVKVNSTTVKYVLDLHLFTYLKLWILAFQRVI